MSDVLSDLKRTAEASRSLVLLEPEKIDAILRAIADAIENEANGTATFQLLSANAADLSRMDPADPKYDRLKLTPERLKGIAGDMRSVAALPSPLGEILEERTVQSGLKLKKIRVPLGVIGIIYEARPNVTFDAFSICFKAGNACVLKGGSDAKDSNEAAAKLMHVVLEAQGIDPSVLLLLPPDRSAVGIMLRANDCIDVLIPRGSQGLIDFVRKNASVPVIETGAGICHVYVDASGDVQKASRIVCNAKVRRPSVCNALDCLIVHRDRLPQLPAIMEDTKAFGGVEVFADDRSYKALSGSYPAALLQHATDASFGTEFLSLRMAIKTVDSAEEAIAHVARYGSKHSESIIAEDEKVIAVYLQRTDAAVVYANASTCFTDGAEFGLGAEIGISTQKLHARGPMALKEMTSYKWVVRGDGQVRG